jgi:neutral ceramidase
MAVQNIKSSSVSWRQGEINFVINRRTSINPNGVVDHALPILKISDSDGVVRAVLVSYACHAVTLGPKNNVVHGDWAGETQIQIEENFSGAIAMVVIGCGVDQNSNLRMSSKKPEIDLENAKKQGKKVLLMRQIDWFLAKPLRH